MSLSAHSPDGALWILFAQDETPLLEITKAPRPGLILDTIYESPTFFSTSRTIARQWTVSNAGVWTLLPVALNQATFEYIEMVTPAGVSWVIGLQDDDLVYLELFTSGIPKNRRLVTTAMHKGKFLWVADNRFPVPGRV